MGLFERITATFTKKTAPVASSPPAGVAVSVRMFHGDEDLEVVGESFRQGELWAICDLQEGDRVRHPIDAVLVPEPQNEKDPNAVAVHANGLLVGYLPRDIAGAYLPGINALMEHHGAYVGLRGTIVGGGHYADGPGRLGVWLLHDPRDFGLSSDGGSGWTGPVARRVPSDGTMRTGFTEAWLTDIEDDTYDLSWFDGLPDDDRPAIAMLRQLLSSEPDPIDRHFQLSELETRLYRCRDLYDTALEEFDEVCRRHDAEMKVICAAFRAKWGKVPLLQTYPQMAIRQQKLKNWEACRWWAERGLSLYGDSGARADAVDDLLKRRNHAIAKCEPTPKAPKQTSSTAQTSAVLAPMQNGSAVSTVSAPATIEILVCTRCDCSFERLRVRGRKPLLCPECRAVAVGS